MIFAGQLLLNDLPDRARLAPGYVRIEGEEIVEVALGDAPAAADHGGPDCLIAPGFIDAHLHLPQFDMQGAHGLPLLEWLEKVTFPSERKWADTAFAQAMSSRVVDRLLAHGTTAIAAFSTVHYEATRAAMRVAAGRGMRGLVGQSLIERHAPDDLCRPAAQILDETANLLDEFPPGERLAAAVTPRFAVSCSADLLADAGRLANERNASIQSHLAETRAECEWVADLFGGNRYVEVYRRAGLLTPRSIYGHGIHLDEADRQVMSDHGAVVAHCPTANAFLRSGSMDRHATLSSGVTMALGSDVGAGFEVSMPRVARAMVETASALGDAFPVAAQAWRQVTAGNADALGWRDAGRLALGCPADLLVIEPSVPWLSSEVDPLSLLLYAWDDRWLKQCWLRGKLAHASG